MAEQEIEGWNWIEALDALDRGSDKKPLTDLLRSDCELPKKAREWLADLIERGVPPNDGRPRGPAYTISDTSLVHLLAVRLVHKYRQQGMSAEDALKEVAKESGLNETSLELSLQGRNSSLRRDLKKK